MLTTDTIPTIARNPLEQRLFAVLDHLAMLLGAQWVSPGAIAEQRDHIEQAIAELQAAQAELDPPLSPES